MKRAISLTTVASFAFLYAACGDNHSDWAEQGYRWVNVDGPYACATERDVEVMTTNRTDATELQMIESARCYYLIPGSIVQIIDEDRGRGMSEMRIPGVTRYLWTYTRFLSKHPIRDADAVIETPENSHFISPAEAAMLPALPAGNYEVR
jgi:hypothetical protein